MMAKKKDLQINTNKENVKNDYRYIEIQQKGQIVRINLNRPERHNALILELISELDQALEEISGMNEILFVVLSGNGRSFCAGADLNWFYSSEEHSIEQSIEQYKHLADLLLRLFQLPQITIATVRGNVFGGGIGLMAACDFVLAEANTRFMFSEVKLGLLPATILPFVANRLSVQNLRKWVLTGNLFVVNEAHRIGLVDEIYIEGNLESELSTLIASFEAASPSAMKKAKQLINNVVSGSIDVADTTATSTILAKALLSPDGQEGIHAFFEKRKPEWGK
ncbi:MAG: enoyl-CoA hydratase-related protein [Prolixibacteraceae bacterium]|nr:enoyl-CoA hydratase-related protein [Prolixibacteraceae bacterium]